MASLGKDLSVFFVWFFALIVISFFLGFLWSKIFPNKKYNIIIFPGVIIHELSHLLACLVVGAKIKGMGIFSSKGSYVAHTKPKIPLIGNFLISFSPIAGGIAVLILSFLFFGYDYPQVGFSSFFDSFFNLIREAFIFSSEQYGNWQFWVFIYIGLSILICLVPSKQDLKNSFLSTIFIFVALLTFLYLGFFDEQILNFLNGYFIAVLGVAIFFGILAVFITVPIYLIKKIIL